MTAHLPAALRAWREKYQLTQKVAAAALKVNRRTYQDWEHGRYAPKHSHVLLTLIKAQLDSEDGDEK